MKRTQSRWIVGLVGLLLFLSACGPTSAPERTPGEAEAPAAEPTAPLATAAAATAARSSPAAATPQSAAPPTSLPTLPPNAAPTSAPTPLSTSPPPPPSEVVLGMPMVIDSAAGRLYMPATVDGIERIVALSAADGQVVTIYDVAGPLAVDPDRGWLYIDQDEVGLLILDAASGEELGSVPLPSSERPIPNLPPQVDLGFGQVLAFRDHEVYIVNVEQQAVVHVIAFDVPKEEDCRDLDIPLPIIQAAFDPVQRLLYLHFVTYACTPWYTTSVLAYDLNGGMELGRGDYAMFPTSIAAGRCLYGTNQQRMGASYRWLWRDGQPHFVSGGWIGTGSFQVDTLRNRLYLNSDQLYVYDGETMALTIRTPPPAEGVLVGYDPGTDQLYYLLDGQLEIRPAASIANPAPEPLLAANPPAAAVGELLVSPRWAQDGTVVGLWEVGLVDGLAGAEAGRFYMGTDRGEDWGVPWGGLRGEQERISALAISPGYAGDHTLLVGVINGGIFRSTDGGASWQPSGAGMSSAYVRQIRLSPAFAVDGTALAWAGTQLEMGSYSPGRLHRSTDGGATWQALGIDLFPVALSLEYAQDRTMMGAQGGWGPPGNPIDNPTIHLSTDGGTSWQQRGELPSAAAVNMISLAPLYAQWEVAFAHSDHTLYRTIDGGQSWDAVLVGTNGEQPQLIYGPESESGRLVLLLTTTMLYRSADGGQSWEANPLPLGDLTPSAIAPSPDLLLDGLVVVGAVDGRVAILDVRELIEGGP